nr:uncharacterized protein LOC129279545 [Lytechinus pictus]
MTRPATYFPDRFEIATGVFISGGSVGVMMMPLVFGTLKDGWRGDDPNIPLDTDLVTNEREHSTQAVETPDTQICPEVKIRWENKGFDERDANITNQSTLNDIEVSDRPVAATSSVFTLGTNSSPTPGLDDESGPASNNFIENGGTYSQMISTFNLLMSFVRFFKDHPIMIIICIEVYTYSLSFSTWLLFTIPNAQAKGLSDLSARQLSIAGGIANFLGRFTSGFITSRNWAPIELWLMIANCISAVAFFVNYVANSFWFLVTLSLLFGFTFGIKISTLFSLVMNVVGEKNYKTGLGVIFLSAGIAYLIFGSSVGAIYDYTQSYNIVFCLMGAVDVFGAILIITPLVWTRLCQKFVT